MTNRNWEPTQWYVSFFFCCFCRIRSIRFALLNYLIRAHRSRWASRSLINSIPTFSHPVSSDRVIAVPSFSSFQIAFYIRRGMPVRFSFFILRIAANRGKLGRPFRIPMLPILGTAWSCSPAQFPGIALPLRRWISVKIFPCYRQTFACFFTVIKLRLKTWSLFSSRDTDL